MSTSVTVVRDTVPVRSRLDLEGIDAFILDMDGVVTNTARVHAAAWKRAFDELLQERSRSGESYAPFDESSDYLRFVDGKPRYEGAASFLASRGISLPYGEPDDPPDRQTVHGIGNRKNEYFVEYLVRYGAEPYPTTVSFVKDMRSRGYRMALFTASKNADKVLESSGLRDLFEVVVDGNDARELGLKGKPSPDIILEAARRLGVSADRAVVIEDALAGVEAGSAGGFATVIGVDRGDQANELRAHGADIVVRDLSELVVEGERRAEVWLPSAMANSDRIFRSLTAGRPAIFLDYDGTLTPIVAEPTMATLSDRMRHILSELGKHCTVSIVSGRDLDNVRKMVGLEQLTYVGSHGFEVLGPEGSYRQGGKGEPFLPSLAKAEEGLLAVAEQVPGAWVERKKFAVTMHYRRVEEKDVPRLERLFDKVASEHPDLRKAGGKKVFELLPNIDWNKGRMVESLLEMMGSNGERTVPLFIGDDVTDEDAFRVLADTGVTVVVSDHPRESAASYSLKDVNEVALFLERLTSLFERRSARDDWVLTYEGYDPGDELLREALCTISNGYFASRASAPEMREGKYHYPGNYVAGIYNRLESDIAGRTIVNESIVNVPNWLFLTFRFDGGDWFDIDEADLDDYRQELDIRNAILTRSFRFTDQRGRRTCIRQKRFASMEHMHFGAFVTTITPENWSGDIEIMSAIDGRVENSLVKRYRQLNNHHLINVKSGVSGEDIIWIQSETSQSRVRIAEAARTRVMANGEVLDVDRRNILGSDHVGQVLKVPVKEGLPIRLEKICTIYTSKDRAISEPLLEAVKNVERVPDTNYLLKEHKDIWDALWERCQIHVETDQRMMAKVLNLHIYHLLQTVSMNTIDLDTGVPPRGLHGEAYRGLIMWDDIFIFPFLNLRIPDVTRSLLLYRFRRLPEARWAAYQAGYQGAMYPWQSGSNGREEAQKLHLNPVSGEWIPDHSDLERHIGLAIAYNVWNYYQVSGDKDFMAIYGAEMLVHIARFWASKVKYNPSMERYEIPGVMGPDEFHERYPGAEAPGINNNAYTNVMAAWALARTLDTVNMLPLAHRRDIWADLQLSDEELSRWDEISRRMYIPFHGDGIISQFDGFDELKELDWKAYMEKYGDIHRLDRILKAEGDSPDNYKVSKQADALMLFYLFSADELREVFDRAGYQLDDDTIRKTVDYYMRRTSHGSTLSRVVHAWVMSRINREASWDLFREALRSDISDTQGGTTHEGIHLGAMAGTVDIVQRCYSGLETRGDIIRFDPRLPAELKRLRFDIDYRHHWINVDIDHHRLRLISQPQEIEPIRVGYLDDIKVFEPGTTLEFDLKQ